MRETVRQNCERRGEVETTPNGDKHYTLWDGGEDDILDAHIYGSGTDIYWSGTDSISVVTTEVREKAVRMLDDLEDNGKWLRITHKTRGHIVDAVLEAVLGQVRVAKEVTSPVLDGVLGYTTTLGLEATRILERGDTIAILEDGGEEGT